MEIDQLETFLVVASLGGFHKAAATLNVSQPAVSARIRALEQSLGVALFSRERPTLTLSEAGRVLRPYAEQLLKTASQARLAVRELQPPSSSPLRIAAGLSISAYFLPDVLKNFQNAYPNITITIRPGHSKEVLDMLLNDEAEIGLARSLNHPEVETLTLRDDPLLLIAHRKHKQFSARLQDVAGWPLIAYERGSSDWTLTQGLFRRAGLMPNIAMEMDTIETAKRMVERGLGLAFLPQLAVVNELRTGKLTMVEIKDAETLHRSLDVVHPRHRPLRKEALAFLRFVREAANVEIVLKRRKQDRRTHRS
jgi:DNA-binding transcriptional LysR family regulator